MVLCVEVDRIGDAGRVVRLALLFFVLRRFLGGGFREGIARCFAFFEDGVDCLSSSFEKAGVCCVVAGGGVEGSAVRFGVGGVLWARICGAGAVLLGEFGGFVEEIACGGEGLGVELVVDGFASRVVDGGGVCAGLLELV